MLAFQAKPPIHLLIYDFYKKINEILKKNSFFLNFLQRKACQIITKRLQ